MKNFQFLKFLPVLLLLGFSTIACSDDDDDNTPEQKVRTKVNLIITASNATQDLQGGNSTIIVEDNPSKVQDLQIYQSESGLYTKDTFTQVSFNNNTGVFTGYIYGRGAIELGTAGMRNYTIVDNKLQVLGAPVTVSNFGNTGTFGEYSYAAAISSGSIMRIDKTGTGVEKFINLTEYAIDGTSPTISGIVDRGNNQIVIGLNYADQDMAAIAFADYDFSVLSTKSDNRIGASYGAWRSVRYEQIGKDDNGNVYVFSGTGENMAGALKIAKGSNDFDPNYLFNILGASGGYRFRKVFHISDDYFLLEFYLEKDKYGNMDASGKFAVVKMSDKSFKWVTGLPEASEISNIGWPEGYNGTIYQPITPTNGKPTVYAIDAKTAVATPRLTAAEGEIIKSVALQLTTVTE